MRHHKVVEKKLALFQSNLFYPKRQLFFFYWQKKTPFFRIVIVHNFKPHVILGKGLDPIKITCGSHTVVLCSAVSFNFFCRKTFSKHNFSLVSIIWQTTVTLPKGSYTDMIIKTSFKNSVYVWPTLPFIATSLWIILEKTHNIFPNNVHNVCVYVYVSRIWNSLCYKATSSNLSNSYKSCKLTLGGPHEKKSLKRIPSTQKKRTEIWGRAVSLVCVVSFIFYFLEAFSFLNTTHNNTPQLSYQTAIVIGRAGSVKRLCAQSKNVTF